MIEDDDFDDLPADPELAFVELELRLRRDLESKIDQDGTGNSYSHYYMEYINKILACTKALELDILSNWSTPSLDDSSSSLFHNFSSDVQNYVVQIKIRNSRRVRGYSVALDDSDKVKIRAHLAKIKLIVEKSDAPIEKKEVIFEKISELLLEVDRSRTRMDAFADFAGRLATISGDFAKEGVEPWVKVLKSIFEILGAAKDEEEKSPKLPKPSERKKLEAPRRQLPEPKPKQTPDDEIPF